MTNQVPDTNFRVQHHDDRREIMREESSREEGTELLASIRDLIMEYNRLAKESPEMGGDAASRRNPSASVEAISSKLAELEDKILPMFGKALVDSYIASEALVDLVTESRLKSEMATKFEHIKAERKNHSEGNDKVKSHVRDKFGVPASEASLKDAIDRNANREYVKRLQEKGIPARKDPVDLQPKEDTIEPAVDIAPSGNDFLTAPTAATEERIPEPPATDYPISAEIPVPAEPATPATESFFDSPKEDNPTVALIPDGPKEEKIEPVVPDAFKPTEILPNIPEVGPQIGALPIERREKSTEPEEVVEAKIPEPVQAPTVSAVPTENLTTSVPAEASSDEPNAPVDRREAVTEWLNLYSNDKQTADRYARFMPGGSVPDAEKTTKNA